MILLRAVIFLAVSMSLLLLVAGVVMFESWTRVQMTAPGVMLFLGGFNLVWGVSLLVCQSKISQLERTLAAQREEDRNFGQFENSIR